MKKLHAESQAFNMELSIINQLGDFISFNQYKPWVEVLRDQTFMIKIDYWFEK